MHILQGSDCISNLLDFLETSVKFQHKFDDSLAHKCMNMSDEVKLKSDSPKCNKKSL